MIFHTEMGKPADISDKIVFFGEGLTNGPLALVSSRPKSSLSRLNSAVVCYLASDGEKDIWSFETDHTHRPTP